MDATAVRVDPTVAAEIASAYLEAPCTPLPFLRAAYEQLAAESDRLFTAITAPERADAVRVRFSTCELPYDSAEELIASVRNEHVLEVTAAAVDRDRKHPLLDSAVGGSFDRFRAVHDILGHARLGTGFDRHGEYATWRFQECFHSALAQRALATELHAKHSVRWTTGESPDHKAVLLDPRLVRRARRTIALDRPARPGPHRSGGGQAGESQTLVRARTA